MSATTTSGRDVGLGGVSPGLTGLAGMVAGLVRLAVARRTAPGSGGESPEAARAVAGVEWPTPREMATARLSAAADDAAELAAGFGQDAAIAAGSVRGIPAGFDSWGVSWELLARTQADRAARCARMAFRLAVQAAALRELADTVAMVDASLPHGACPVCVDRQGQPGQSGLCDVCWLVTR